LFNFCSSKLAHITHRAPFRSSFHLKDADMQVDAPVDHLLMWSVTVLATEPLTDNELDVVPASGVCGVVVNAAQRYNWLSK
jgi:predicted glutamine amidotransferase